MGGLITLLGTSDGSHDTSALYDAWQKALTDKAGVYIQFDDDALETVIDGVNYRIRREFFCTPDQVTVQYVPPAPPAPASQTRYVTAQPYLRVRGSPSTAGDIKGHIDYGTAVQVIDSGTAGWAQIASGTFQGCYLSTDWLSATRP